MIGTIVFLLVAFGMGWAYYTVKEKAKRQLFFRDQYERQQALTHRNTVYTTEADIGSLKASLARHIPLDDSAKAAFLGGAITVTEETPTSIAYRHSSRIGTAGGGDEFSASVTFHTLPDSRTQAVVSIDSWREKDGVTRRRGIGAMTDFMSSVDSSIRAADPLAIADTQD